MIILGGFMESEKPNAALETLFEDGIYNVSML